MIQIKSFGYGHDEPPPAHMVLDLRELFKDPHIRPELQQLTGTNPRVIQNVFRQPGAEAFLTGVRDAVLAIRRADPVIAFGCVDGRHRSVAFADALAMELRASLRNLSNEVILVDHRDIGKPVPVR